MLFFVLHGMMILILTICIFDEMLESLLHVLTMLFHLQACKWETWQQD